MDQGSQEITNGTGDGATNFGFLATHEEQFVRLGRLAERYFSEDPNTCLLKLRQFCELLARRVAANVGIATTADEAQYDLLRRLQDRAILPREIAQLFNEVRRAGNEASHDGLGDHRTALSLLRVSWQLGVWFHRTFADPDFKSGPFTPPSAPARNESAELASELARLKRERDDYLLRDRHTAEKLAVAEATLRDALDEKTFWEQMAVDAERAKVEVEKRLAEATAAAAAAAPTTAASRVNQVVRRAQKASDNLELDEAQTREMIDAQLRRAGWEADTAILRYEKGARPEKNKNRAIAEWPTRSGPADYVLFVGLTPVAVVEAKRRNRDVSAALQQAKRYARGFAADAADALTPPAGGPWGEYGLPFVFSTNGRPFLRQLSTRSGVWFCDVRRPENLARPLEGWYTPQGLADLLKRDHAAAHRQLEEEPFDYGFALRDYQKTAIRTVEDTIARGEQRSLLVAMATGTGKTKTCIALIYRLLKTQRFRRVLFLVDRSALGEQASNAFKDTRMEGLRTFADTFGIRDLRDDGAADAATADAAVHVATVQSMVRRTLGTDPTEDRPAVDAYDCVVVDECHRGYLLDRELSDAELEFRSHEDYISKYRRVLDYFDAVKIGLTATPALHTTDIFGRPVFTYTYREAVIDGFLVDHEPPIRITTELSRSGIVWKPGETVKTYDPRRQQIDLAVTPDEIKVEVEGFNRKVITESFNRVVCEYLAQEIDPSAPAKTLVFCVNDAHADLVVALLKEAFAARYGTVEDDAVLKITGAADQPLSLIRRYKNERLPSVAVTVDLLTTGIDVPEIGNLVFLRRVNSRILFDQMLGRATRLCPEIGKDAFRVFDAVNIYDALGDMTAMQPVVVDPSIRFETLETELTTVTDPDALALVRDQFVAKLRRVKSRLTEWAQRDFETLTGGFSPDDFARTLRTLPPDEIGAFLSRFAGIGALLDGRASRNSPDTRLLISDAVDDLYSVTRGYGEGGAARPDDYLDAFTAFLNANRDALPALTTVLTRPRDLTRRQLKELALELDRAGFSEAALTTAWREKTNQEIAARIVGFIRAAAAGDPLIPYDLRVESALQRLLASRAWTTPQRQWLQRIAAQTKANVVVDRDALDDPNLLFRREGGGFARLDKVFDGQLADILDIFREEVWK
jgi:Type I site-specific restriction-modification system, R (restriction) subunit and related helicases